MTGERPTFKTVRTVTSRIERDEAVDAAPKYAVGDYMRVYNGQYEGHRFWIKAIRYNHDIREFEYLYGVALMGGWYCANRLELLERRSTTESDR